MFEQAERWQLVYDRIPEYTKRSQPHEAALETIDVIRGFVARIEAAFAVFSRALSECRPDVIVILGDDQGDVFDAANVPQFATYLGAEYWGLDKTDYWPLHERKKVIFKNNPAVARAVLEGLNRRGFDVAFGSKFAPRGRPDIGVSHMVTHIIPKLTPQLDVPVVPLYINEYFAPMPTGSRCFDLGSALGEILQARPERIVLYASGGLSHDPAGPRAGWIDEPLDRWFLERLQLNDLEPLRHMFQFDSDTLRGGSGEMRAWISVAAAMVRPARILDYIRAHHSKAGIGFAIWEA